jgi:hypothetical protein
VLTAHGAGKFKFAHDFGGQHFTEPAPEQLAFSINLPALFRFLALDGFGMMRGKCIPAKRLLS